MTALIVVRLEVSDLAFLDVAVKDPASSGGLLGCHVAEGWVIFPGAMEATRDAVARDPESTRWGPRLFVLAEPAMLVGWGGFKGPPQNGVVKIGYAVAPSWQGRGVASAAVRELLREAFQAPEVQAVVAHTLPEPGASGRVLEKAGFVSRGEVADVEVGTARLYRLDRARRPPLS